ncbi:hypothetical protein NBRC111894_3892 [Sporolactobacillus inulinus]|uniref:Uncharacterized protein n=1 Tax=Sporolactobacillus inulinus TaxID=2078 RepID=A0A4Y1ZJ07_9BACL|nr:hypothetical protein NBRC111894_3892 [Sporolactobacillus inulinus]
MQIAGTTIRGMKDELLLNYKGTFAKGVPSCAQRRRHESARRLREQRASE